MPHAYTEDQLAGSSPLTQSTAQAWSHLRTGKNPAAWVFHGYLMGSREIGCAGAGNQAESPVNKGRSVFDGYLMGSGFSSGLPPRKSLDKMTSNQAKFVKSRLCQNQEERRESLIFKGFPFDIETGESVSFVCAKRKAGFAMFTKATMFTSP